MQVKIHNFELMTDSVKEKVLLEIFKNAEMGWITGVLKEWDIPQRTKIYYAFQSPYLYNRRNKLNDQQIWEITEQQKNEQDVWMRFLREQLIEPTDFVEKWAMYVSPSRLQIIMAAAGLRSPVVVELRW